MGKEVGLTTPSLAGDFVAKLNQGVFERCRIGGCLFSSFGTLLGHAGLKCANFLRMEFVHTLNVAIHVGCRIRQPRVRLLLQTGFPFSGNVSESLLSLTRFIQESRLETSNLRQELFMRPAVVGASSVCFAPSQCFSFPGLRQTALQL